MSSLEPRRFDAPIDRAAGRARIVLPFDPDAAWGAKARHHVTGTVGGCPIRGELAAPEGAATAGDGPAGGSGTDYALALGPAWLRDAPAAVRDALARGAPLAVVLAPEGPLGARLAPDLRAALDAAPDARAFFEALPTFYRNNFVRWVDDAKRDATRAARVAEVVRLCGAGERER